MPHANIKLYSGRTEEQKKLLADRITKVIMEVAQVEEYCVSVAIEDVDKEVWDEEVYTKEIIGKEEVLYKQPGY